MCKPAECWNVLQGVWKEKSVREIFGRGYLKETARDILWIPQSGFCYSGPRGEYKEAGADLINFYYMPKRYEEN